MDYFEALMLAWSEMIRWVGDKKLLTENEEFVQCFLYRGIVNQLGTAQGVRVKPTAIKPRQKGSVAGNMHFPDFILGEPPQVVVEIKYARKDSSILTSCKSDIRKMLDKYGDNPRIKRVFILFDEHEKHCFLSKKQLVGLEKIDSNCTILMHPAQVHPCDTPAKKAWDTMKAAQ